jgi:hypothetical protein
MKIMFIPMRATRVTLHITLDFTILIIFAKKHKVPQYVVFLFSSLKFKHFTQQFVLKHSRCFFFQNIGRPGFTPVQRQNIIHGNISDGEYALQKKWFNNFHVQFNYNRT